MSERFQCIVDMGLATVKDKTAVAGEKAVNIQSGKTGHGCPHVRHFRAWTIEEQHLSALQDNIPAEQAAPVADVREVAD